MRHASTRALYSYWDTLTAGRTAPSRAEIDPKAIARTLGDLFILDGDFETYNFRLAGSRLVHAIGRDVTGTAFLSIFDVGALRTASEMLEVAVSSAEPVLLGLRDTSFVPAARVVPPETPLDRLARIFGKTVAAPNSGESRPDRRRPFEGHGEMILLPLFHRGKLGGRVLGALTLFEPPQQDRKAQIELSITGTRVLGRHALPKAPLGLVSGDRAGEILVRHGHLAVLRGGRVE